MGLICWRMVSGEVQAKENVERTRVVQSARSEPGPLLPRAYQVISALALSVLLGDVARVTPPHRAGMTGVFHQL